MTDHPAMFDTSPDTTKGAARTSVSNNQPSLKTTLLRAVMVGLLGGVAVIGLIENFDRFGDPDTIHAERIAQGAPLDISPAGLQETSMPRDARADRLDFGMIPAELTDLAAR